MEETSRSKRGSSSRSSGLEESEKAKKRSKIPLVNEDWIALTKAALVGVGILSNSATLETVEAEVIGFTEKVDRFLGSRRLWFLKAIEDGSEKLYFVKEQTNIQRGACEFEIGKAVQGVFDLHNIVAPIVAVSATRGGYRSHYITFPFFQNAKSLDKINKGEVEDEYLFGGLDALLQILSPFDPHITTPNRLTNNEYGASQVIMTPDYKFRLCDFGNAILTHELSNSEGICIGTIILNGGASSHDDGDSLVVKTLEMFRDRMLSDAYREVVNDLLELWRTNHQTTIVQLRSIIEVHVP